LRELLIATRNKRKLQEIRRLLRGSSIKTLSLDDFNGLPEVKEDGKTFRANARKKALEISKRIETLVVADDSGLEVPALGNKPGIRSARYAGSCQDDDKNIDKLLKKMKTLKERSRKAHFKCVICISKGRRVIGMAEGRVEGAIASARSGKTGFGYDPVFIPEGFNKSFAQLGSKLKDSISHRAIALKNAKKVILAYFQRYP